MLIYFSLIFFHETVAWRILFIFKDFYIPNHINMFQQTKYLILTCDSFPSKQNAL